MPPRPPKVNALVPCMNAGRDDSTRRLDLIGVIGKMETAEFPVQLPGLAVFLNLTNLQGNYRLAVELIDLENDERMAGVRQDADFALFDPLFVWTEIAMLPGPLTFAHPGRYACRLLLDDEVLHETVFVVAQLHH